VWKRGKWELPNFPVRFSPDISLIRNYETSRHVICESHLSCLQWIQHVLLFYRKAVSADISEQRILRSTPDWSETASSSEHLWVPTSASGDFCYVGENDCTVSIAFSLPYYTKELEYVSC
jgi:hypothetical protein